MQERIRHLSKLLPHGPSNAYAFRRRASPLLLYCFSKHLLFWLQETHRRHPCWAILIVTRHNKPRLGILDAWVVPDMSLKGRQPRTQRSRVCLSGYLQTPFTRRGLLKESFSTEYSNKAPLSKSIDVFPRNMQSLVPSVSTGCTTSS